MRTKFAILLAIAVVCVTTAMADWPPESKIPGDTIVDRQFGTRGLVFGTDGVGHLFWGNLMNGLGISCQRYDPLSGWTPYYQVGPAGSNKSVAIDADGTTIHMVYNDSTLCYRKCVRDEYGNDEWGPIVRLYREHGAGTPCMASVPGDPGHVVVCWVESWQTQIKKTTISSSAIGFMECVNGVWGAMRRLDSTGTFMRDAARISVAPNGDVFIAYVGNDDNMSGQQVYVKTRHNGVWGSTVDVTQGWAQDVCRMQEVRSNPYTGNPHVVFSYQKTVQISRKVKDISYRVCHTYRNSQGVWMATPESISVPRHGLSIGTSYLNPSMDFASDGFAHVAWHEHYPQPSGVMYSSCSAEGGIWSTPAWVVRVTSNPPDDGPASIAVDEAAGAVHVAWKRQTQSGREAREIWWRSGDLGGDGPEGRPTALPQSGIRLFPNPAKAGRVTVQYSLPRSEPLRVTLLDVSGRAVMTQEVAVACPKGSFALDASGLNSGVYILKLESGSSSQTRKLVIN